VTEIVALVAQVSQ
jgi:hypothetical protein